MTKTLAHKINKLNTKHRLAIHTKGKTQCTSVRRSCSRFGDDEALHRFSSWRRGGVRIAQAGVAGGIIGGVVQALGRSACEGVAVIVGFVGTTPMGGKAVEAPLAIAGGCVIR